MELKEDESCSIQKSPSPSGMTFFKNVLYIGIGYSLIFTGQPSNTNAPDSSIRLIAELTQIVILGV